MAMESSLATPADIRHFKGTLHGILGEAMRAEPSWNQKPSRLKEHILQQKGRAHARGLRHMYALTLLNLNMKQYNKLFNDENYSLDSSQLLLSM